MRLQLPALAYILAKTFLRTLALPEPPKRIAIYVFDCMKKAQVYFNSPAYKELMSIAWAPETKGLTLTEASSLGAKMA